MAHNEHNRPRGGGMILIVIAILIFVFAPSHFKQDLGGGIAIMTIGFVLGGIGFYVAFLRKRR